MIVVSFLFSPLFGLIGGSLLINVFYRECNGISLSNQDGWSIGPSGPCVLSAGFVAPFFWCMVPHMFGKENAKNAKKSEYSRIV